MTRRRRPARRSLAWLTCAAALAVAALALGLPWLTRKREVITAVPVPPPLDRVASLTLRPGQRACTSPVPFSSDTGRVLLGVRGARRGPALALDAIAPGYTARGSLMGGYRGPGVLTVPVSGPARDVIGRLCIGNRGRGALLLAGNARPGRAHTTVDGVAVGTSPVLVLLTPDRSPLSRLIFRVADHMAAFVPVPAGVIVALWALLVVLVSAAVPWACLARLRRPSAPRPRVEARSREGTSTG